ncbi:Hypothetical protein R9X50_00199800 [Acrodontium crateriforme]|uniref:MOSC domain-containing protein n=1 Tax=Acrodontium crateriforme TaxID=150365 RepID=A0AAQ3RAJ5_9PEZI|nr:Hypothetical protein R9X50_00199800 [Acrodontium crateriforme]
MLAIDFFVHYVQYLASPQILLTIAVLAAPYLLSNFARKRLSTRATSTGVPGCRRLGLYRRSNLKDQYEDQSTTSNKPTIKALFTYPIKSCRGVELAASEVESKGLKFDRMFTFAKWLPKKRSEGSSEISDGDILHEWRFMTLRENPRLALIQTQLWLPDPRTAQDDRLKNKGSSKATKSQAQRRSQGSDLVGQLDKGRSLGPAGTFAENGGCLLVQFPYSPAFNPFGLRNETVTFQVPLTPTETRAEIKKYSKENIVIWKDYPKATNVTNEISPDKLQKLKEFLDVEPPLALFRVDDAHLRSVQRCLPKEKPDHAFRVGFVDAFSVNLLGITSVQAVDESISATSEMKGKLDALRFRANIYITGTPAFAEDSWKKLTLGRRIGRDEKGLFETEGEYHVACRTARCTLPNVDPETGLRDRNEPYAALNKTRKVDEGAYPHPVLGMQMLPMFEHGMIKVGDEVNVLETGEHRYEKMFT